MKRIAYFLILCASLLTFSACSDDDDVVSQEKNGPKPAMDITVSPQGGMSFGDVIYVTGTMTDERNLEHYELTLKDDKGDTLATKYQMLLGKEFSCNDHLQIPLPKNAKQEDLTLEVKLDNTRNGELVQEFAVNNVVPPTFDALNIILGNGQVINMIKDGDEFVTPTEVVFPAGVKGIISTTTSKNGIWWGTTNGEIASMASDSILIGGDVEASFTVRFNPVTFALTLGEHHVWSPLDASDCYYILGTISGHWQDGEITEERTKMKMAGYSSGNDAYYTWTAPEGDNPETGMWGSTAAGVFRLKKGGTGEFILWDGSKIMESKTDDKSKSFPLTAGGPFTIRANFTNGTCSSVVVSGGGKSVIFSNDNVVINGTKITPEISFAGKQLKLQSGSSYIYSGEIKLSKGQTISSVFDLSPFATNPDLFSGQGNPTWTLKSASDTYSVRLDPFACSFYACPVSGYPVALYMDGWSWAPTETSTAVVWDAANVLPLVETSAGVYEATFYDFGWGGNACLYMKWPGKGEATRLPLNNFNSSYIESLSDRSFLLPSGVGYYKIVVNVGSGFTINADGTITPKGNTKYTLDFKKQ